MKIDWSPKMCYLHGSLESQLEQWSKSLFASLTGLKTDMKPKIQQWCSFLATVCIVVFDEGGMLLTNKCTHVTGIEGL